MAWDDDHSTAADPDNPSANEQLTADEWDAHVLSQKNGRPTAWVVYTDGTTWYAEGGDGNSGSSGSDPATVLQYALDRGNTMLVDSVPSDDPITTTVDAGSNDFLGPGARGSASIYVDTDQANPGFKKTDDGRFMDVWLRGDAGGSFSSGTLLRLEDMGRGSLVENVSLSLTRGNGLEVAGCQQMEFRNVSTSTCGDPSSDTWHLYLTDSPTQDLETNANVWKGIQRHGSPNTDGGWIAMRIDHGSSDRPRTQLFKGFNVENGPTDSSTPLIEVSGRDHVWWGGRIGNIDVASSIFKVVGSRARDCIIGGMRAIADTDDPATTDFWDANGNAVATPLIVGCPQIDMTGKGVILDNYNQTNKGLQIIGCDFKSTGTIVDVTASKDAGDPVSLVGVHGTGTISVQGARLAVANVPEASWGTHANDFGPRLIADDGSFTPRFFTADTAGGNGLASHDFSASFSLLGNNDRLFAQTARGTGTVIEGVSLDDTTSDGYPDTARAHVVNVSDGTDAADGVTVEFAVLPAH